MRHEVLKKSVISAHASVSMEGHLHVDFLSLPSLLVEGRIPIRPSTSMLTGVPTRNRRPTNALRCRGVKPPAAANHGLQAAAEVRLLPVSCGDLGG